MFCAVGGWLWLNKDSNLHSTLSNAGGLIGVGEQPVLATEGIAHEEKCGDELLLG